MNSNQYRSEIDGLRAIAVMPVIVFHLDLSWLPGGYLGVDVFFVISGFLISLIILRELKQDTFRFTDFWKRRIKRILPALLAMVFFTSIIIWLFGFKGTHPETGRQSISTLFSAANFYFWQNTGDYWGPTAETFPFLHTWSLSVEEQFYLFFPVLLFLAHKYLRDHIDWLFLTIIAASLTIFVWGIKTHPIATFYLLPSRAWELALGGLLAYAIISERVPRLSNHWAISGLTLILAGYLFVPAQSPAAILPVIGTLLVLAYGHKGIGYRILALPPLVSIGKLSYSLYLWHWPVIVLSREIVEAEFTIYQQLIFMAALSVVSYYLIERPARYGKNTLPLIIGGFSIVLAFGTMNWMSSGIYDTSRYSQVSYHGYFYDLKPNNFETTRSQGARKEMFLPPREASADAYLKGGIIIGPDTENPDIVVLGDSHGVMWSNVINSISSEMKFTTSFYSMDGINPLFSTTPSKNQQLNFLTSADKYQFDLARLEHIQKWKPKLVILVARWSILRETKLGEETVEFLANNADQVIILGEPPALTFGNRFAVQQLAYLDVQPTVDQHHYLPMNQDELNSGIQYAQRLTEKHSNVVFLPTHDLYTRGPDALVLMGRDVIYYDDDHLTDFGTNIAKHRLHNSIIKHLNRPPTMKPIM